MPRVFRRVVVTVLAADYRAALTRQPSGSTWWLNFDQRRANTSPTRFLRGELEWPV